MTELIIVVAVVAWYAIGLFSAVYWWTKNRDLTTDDRVFAVVTALFGPIAFFVGWVCEGDTLNKERPKKAAPPRVLVPKRRAA